MKIVSVTLIALSICACSPRSGYIPDKYAKEEIKKLCALVNGQVSFGIEVNHGIFVDTITTGYYCIGNKEEN